ncbi:hypothetical protein E2C01_019452 [Portunus trituberculatus]|uniref:Uncharacterized protein n=1 Tax=Portunus trituberculatus TaxID=210409 RepID=A0A5B7DZ06_PORTR|nr:hypothetical protein [Portunus trituberculatus]
MNTGQTRTRTPFLPSTSHHTAQPRRQSLETLTRRCFHSVPRWSLREERDGVVWQGWRGWQMTSEIHI